MAEKTPAPLPPWALNADDVTAWKTPERFEYVPIVDRPKLELPAPGKRIIVWPVVNVEEWDVTKPMPRAVGLPPGGQVVLPDTQNWGWHEYGMRVGIWRFLDLFRKHDIRPTVSINAKVCETRPRLARAMLDDGWEFMAHCYEQMHIAKIADQRAMMRHTIEVLRQCTGQSPLGWLGPGRGQTFATLDYMTELGFKWFGDFIMDDLPVWVRTKNGPILSLPYTVELNDIPVMNGAQHESDVFLKRCHLIYETMHRDALLHDNVRVFSFGIHPYISGAAHRIGYLDQMLAFLRSRDDVCFMNSEQLYSWYRKQVKPNAFERSTGKTKSVKQAK
jgi:allantoinase